MSITGDQRKRVARYLREVGELLRDLPREQRDHALDRVNRRIMDRLADNGNGPVTDEQLGEVLQAVGSPTIVAGKLRARGERLAQVDSRGEEPVSPTARSAGAAVATATSPTPQAATEDTRRWLGVCEKIASYLQLEPWVVRLIVILIGIGTGPLALWAYIGAYAYFRKAGELAPPPEPTHWLDIVWAAGRAFVLVLVIYLGVSYALDGADWFLRTYAETNLSAAVARYAWYPQLQFTRFVQAAFTALPFAVLSALPVPSPWRSTLDKLAYAVIAIYSLYVAYGVASLFVGAGLTLQQNIPPDQIVDIVTDFELPF